MTTAWVGARFTRGAAITTGVDTTVGFAGTGAKGVKTATGSVAAIGVITAIGVGVAIGVAITAGVALGVATAIGLGSATLTRTGARFSSLDTAVGVGDAVVVGPFPVPTAYGAPLLEGELATATGLTADACEEDCCGAYDPPIGISC